MVVMAWRFRKRQSRSGRSCDKVGWSRGRLDAGFGSSTSLEPAGFIIGWDASCDDLNATGLRKLVVQSRPWVDLG